MKKSIYFILAVMTMAFVVTTTAFSMGQKENTQPIKIGAVLPLTGFFSYFGELNAKAIKLAAKNLNDNGYNIELFLKDNQSSVPNGLTAANMLLNTKDLDAIITTPSALGLAINPILESKKSILHLALSGHPEILKTQASTVRAWLNPRDEAQKLSDFLNKKQEIVKILTIIVNDDRGLSMFDDFKARLKGKTVSKVLVKFGEKDFRNMLIANQLSQKDGVVIFSYGSSIASALLKQINEMTPELPVFGTTAFASDTIRKLNPQINNGVTFVSTPFDLGVYNDKAINMVKTYKEMYKDQGNIILGQAFAYMALVSAAEYFSNNDPKQGGNIKSGFINYFKSSTGVIGSFGYYGMGEMKCDLVMAEYQNQKIVEIKDNE